MVAIDTVARWAADELAVWPSMSRAAYTDACEHLLREHCIYAIDIDQNGVQVRHKDGASGALPYRAGIYANYILNVLRNAGLSYDVTLLVNTIDEAPERHDAPVFSFQRSIGSRGPLLPDIDTIERNFYPDWGLPDIRPFKDKLDSAIFVGSTTGVLWVEREHLADPFPRLRAHRFFRDDPRVHFRLPSVVQVRERDVVDALHAEGLGGPHVQWVDQLLHKIVLSIDGNGAALSRPFMGLASNSALVRYASNNEAWYFRHLVPNEHYVQVYRDEDVLAIVEGDMMRHEPIAKSGKAFVDEYLTPRMYAKYMLTLIDQLASRVDG